MRNPLESRNEAGKEQFAEPIVKFSSEADIQHKIRRAVELIAIQLRGGPPSGCQVNPKYCTERYQG